jgi:hypothetical protein
MKYKALTLTPPWGTLIAIGAKHIETRSWETLCRGPLLIHQGSNLKPVGGEQGLWELCNTEPFVSVLWDAGIRRYPPARDFPRGAIVAVCTLLDCVPTQHPGIANEPGKPWFTGARKGIGQHYYEVPPPRDSNEYAFGDYSPGRYAWLLADVRALPTPIPARGYQGLWTWEGEL